MSYVRFYWHGSDVYVYDHVNGWVECCGCRLGDSCYRTRTLEEMGQHLLEHISAGHCVPAFAFENMGLPVPPGASHELWDDDDERWTPGQRVVWRMLREDDEQ